MSERSQRSASVPSFEMPIDSVRSIVGRGTVVTGTIRQGAIKVGNSVTITGPGRKPTSSVVTAVTMSGRTVGDARTGDTVGVLLPGVDPDDVATGHVLRAG